MFDNTRFLWRECNFSEIACTTMNICGHMIELFVKNALFNIDSERKLTAVFIAIRLLQ